MKNQYFGDTRDLFTYDLALEILLTTGLDIFTFIPMLTPDDSPNEGNRIRFHRKHAGYRRKELVDFLQRCVSSGERNIRKLEEFFDYMNRANIYGKRMKIYIHKPDELFSISQREEYFQSIPDWALKNALVFLDPDNGLEVKSSRGVKHLRYDELRYILGRIEQSAVMIFQFIPRVKREPYFRDISMRIIQETGWDRVYYISDNQIVFFFLSQVDIEKSLKRYARLYNLIFGEMP